MIPERIAGILIPLFSLRSPGDRGRGDIGGLAAMGELALAMGHRLIQLLPIDETPPDEASPYSAMSVLAIDPRYIAITQPDPAATAINRDHARLSKRKESALREAFARFSHETDLAAVDAFRQFVAANRDWLDDYALFRVLREQFGGVDWSRWPDQFRRHLPVAIAEARRDHAPAIAFFQYLQWIAHTQWLDARAALRTRGVFLGGDLAFSPSNGSVEVWAHQAMFDLTRSVGAPPDAFSATGQRWGLPMPDWSRMYASGFALLRTRIRRARELYDFLRVDHVVGLFRTYGYTLGDETTPDAFDPPSEDAQRAQGDELLRLIIEEAGPLRIIAEDLGVIPPFVRATLTRLGLPGYKIARWERDWSAPAAPFIPPAHYPEVALATTGTHDTDTLAEWWETIDENERRQLLLAMGVNDESAAYAPALMEPVLDRILEALYASPAQLVITPIQDLFGCKDRINVPGTIAPTNWTWRIPFDPAHANDDPAIRARIDQIRAIALRTRRFAPG